GGDPRMVDDPGRLPRAPRVETLRAARTAYVRRIAADEVGLASVRLGAGRETKGQAIDHRTGIVLHAKVGARVERGAAFADVHHGGKPADKVAIEQVRDAFTWSAGPVVPRKLVLGRVAV
ncbi:MAG: pyrimidine-nucleoside phosphorylase, partial [Chloroflexota bacterium]|nr:pyrimidine-nucleoside phosphorylase [Chloroflexota bacterium]